VITEGTITFVVDGEDRVVEAGHVCDSGQRARTRRATTATREVVGYDIFSPPRANPDWQEESGARRRRWIDERASA